MEGVTFEPLMVGETDWAERVREFGPKMIISDLLQLRSVRQAVRVEWVVGVMVLEER